MILIYCKTDDPLMRVILSGSKLKIYGLARTVLVYESIRKCTYREVIFSRLILKISFGDLDTLQREAQYIVL